MTTDPQHGPFEALGRRIRDRDDLLTVAAEATVAAAAATAIGDTDDDGSSASVMERHLARAEVETGYAARALHYKHAALTMRFRLMTEPGLTLDDVPPEHRPQTLLARAAELLEGPLGARDLGEALVVDSVLTRDLRLGLDPHAALARAERPPRTFLGTGADMLLADFEHEQAAAAMDVGGIASVRDQLEEQDAYYHGGTGAGLWFLGGRHDASVGMTQAATGEVASASDRFVAAAQRMASSPDETVREQVLRLSALLGSADCTAFLPATEDRSLHLVRVCEQALDETEAIMERWGVIARSRSPLSRVVRKTLGDIATYLASRSTSCGPVAHAAGRLGLRVSLVAKHGGLAEMIRLQRQYLDSAVGDVLDLVVDEEHRLAELGTDRPDERAAAVRRLAEHRAELNRLASPLLAGLVLPGRVDVDRVLAQARHRVVLDFVRLPCTDAGPRWFRAVAETPESVVFERMKLGSAHDEFFASGDSGRGILQSLWSDEAQYSRAWSDAVDQYLPSSLVVRLRTAGQEPIQLLISPHRELCRVPWAALQLEIGTRLVERAVVAQTPLLSTMTELAPPPAVGPALVRLVGPDPTPLEASAPERRGWGMAAGVMQAACTFPDRTSDPIEGSYAQALGDREWGMTYFAGHGRGSGLRQWLETPERLTAARALNLRWPASVFLNACHVGEVDDDEDADPTGFVVAVMAGGARSVVAGLQTVWARDAADIGCWIAEHLDGSIGLEAALRDAQLRMATSRPPAPLALWAALAVFVR
jgi:CHAT domain